MSQTRSKLLSSLVLLLLIAALFLGWSVWQRFTLAQTSQQLSLQLIASALADQDANALREHGGAALFQQWRGEQLNQFLRNVDRRLGPLNSIDSISGGIDYQLLPWQRTRPSASYRAQVTLGGQAAEVQLDFVWERDRWLLQWFLVQAEALQS